MGRYNFNSRRTLVNVNGVKAREIDDLATEMKATRLSGGFTWSDDKALNDLLHTATAVKITVQELPNGDEVNRFLAKMPDGSQVQGRLYGTDKELVPERELTSEEIKKAVFGRMKDGDKFVRDEMYDAESGEKLLVKRKYLCVNPAILAK